MTTPTAEASSAPTPQPGRRAEAVLVAAFIIAVLYFGREVSLPIAMALLLSFVLTPPVKFLEWLRLPRPLAVGVVVTVACAGVLSLVILIASQVTQLSADLPKYQSTLRDKMQTLRGAALGGRTLERAAEILNDLGKEIESPATQLDQTRRSPEKPMIVEVRPPDSGALQSLSSVLRAVLSPLTNIGIVVVFVIFILVQRDDLRNRVIRLAGARDLQKTTAALDDAGERLSRFFLAQLALNSIFGLAIGTGLWAIGVPSAPLWGALAMVLRFVPYLGAFLSAAFPVVLAIAVGQDWTMLLWTVLLFACLETIVGQFIEPWVYGRSVGLSPVAVIVSAVFWTWIWGPVGLILATPLSVCLAVAGRHVEALKFLAITLGDEPPLSPPELTYQRLLAGDPIEATDQAQAFLKQHRLIEYYQEILIESLTLASIDAERGMLDANTARLISNGVAEIIDDLAAHDDTLDIANASEKADEPSGLQRLGEQNPQVKAEPIADQWRAEGAVLCLGGIGPLDDAAAMIVTHLLKAKGVGAHADTADALSISRIFALGVNDARLICICYVQRPSEARLRYVIRRLRKKAPDISIAVSLLGEKPAETEVFEVGNVVFHTDLASTINGVLSAARNDLHSVVEADVTAQ